MIRSTIHLALASIPAALVLLLGDTLRLVPQASRFLSEPLDTMALAVVMGSLHTTSIVACSSILALLITVFGKRSTDSVVDFARSEFNSLLFTDKNEPKRGAGILAFLLSTVLVFVGTYCALEYLIISFKDTQKIVFLSSLMCALLAILFRFLPSFVTPFLIRIGSSKWGFRAIHARTMFSLVTMVLIAGAVFAIVFERRIFLELDGWLLYFYLIALAVFLASFLALPRRFLDAVFTKRWPTLILVSLLWFSGFFFAASNGPARGLVALHTRSASHLLLFWSTVFDLDRDGYSSWLGGGDCAPFSAAIHPGAIEIAANGIDDDCYDGDLAAPPPLHPYQPTSVQVGDGKPNVVVFFYDAMRRDAAGVYGATNGTTPNLDLLAKEAFVFEDMIAVSTWTMAAFPTYLTGLYTSEIPGYYGKKFLSVFPRKAMVLPTPLRQHGYHTAWVTSGLTEGDMGKVQDIDDYRLVSKSRKGVFASRIADESSDIIDQTPRNKPLFLVVHFMDPHDPYEPPKQFQYFGTSPKQKYFGEIRNVDEQFGRVIAKLKSSGRYDNTVVVVTSDHGEGFGEHGINYHGRSLYWEEVRLPFVVRLPGVQGKRIPGVVSAVDVAPTIWDLTGVPVTTPIRGRSLAPAMLLDKALPAKPAFSELTRNSRIFALTTEDYRLRFDQKANVVELFDRNRDPLETKNVAGDLPHIVQEMRRTLAQQMAGIAFLSAGDVSEKEMGLQRRFLDSAHVAYVINGKRKLCTRQAVDGFHKCKGQPKWVYAFAQDETVGKKKQHCIRTHIPHPKGAMTFEIPYAMASEVASMTASIIDLSIKGGGEPVAIKISTRPEAGTENWNLLAAGEIHDGKQSECLDTTFPKNHTTLFEFAAKKGGRRALCLRFSVHSCSK